MPALRFSYVAIVVLVTLSACGHRVTANARTHPVETAANASRGASIFSVNCAACHGASGAGDRIGPSLRGIRTRMSPDAVRAAIVDPQPPMPKLYPAVLTGQDVDDVTAYVEHL